MNIKNSLLSYPIIISSSVIALTIYVYTFAMMQGKVNLMEQAAIGIETAVAAEKTSVIPTIDNLSEQATIGIETAVASTRETATTDMQTAVASVVTLLTPTGTPTAVANIQPSFGKACLFTGNRFEGIATPANNPYIVRSVDSKLSGFPEFRNWCKDGIQNYLTTQGTNTQINLPFDLFTGLSTERSGPGWIVIMLTAELPDRIEPTNSAGRDIGTVSIENENRSNSLNVALRLGETIDIWNYHFYRDTINTRSTRTDYVRLWSGYDRSENQIGAKAVHIGALVIKIDDLNGFYQFSIKDNDSTYNINVFGALLITGELVSEENNLSTEIFRPLCLNQDNIERNDQTRDLDQSDLIDFDRDYYRFYYRFTRETECQQLGIIDDRFPELLVKKILPETETKPLPPLVVWKTLYETRPSQRDVTSRPVQPKIMIKIPEYTSELQQIHLMMSARNLCNPNMSNRAREGLDRMGEVILTFDDGSRSDPIYLAAGRQVRQGRSGLSSDRCKLVFEDDQADIESYGRPGPPLVARSGNDTERKPVALWLDVLTIKISTQPGRKLTGIEIIDNTPPEPREANSGSGTDSVNYNDPYFTLYGITLELAPNTP